MDVTPTSLEKSLLIAPQGVGALFPSQDCSPSRDVGESMLSSSPSRPSPTKRYRCKEPELLESVKSGRVIGKQPDPRPVVVKRNTKLCQAADCKFSTGQPGQPARAKGSAFCTWCEPGAVAKTAGNKRGQKDNHKGADVIQWASSYTACCLGFAPE